MVGVGGNELAQQVSIGTVDFHSIGAGGNRRSCCVAELCDGGLDVPGT